MKVTNARPRVRALASALVAVAVLATALISGPAPAQAITRSKILARSKVWIVKRIPYSQSRHYRGYRQDCSGFVSMAWGLKRSYTTRNISSVARRIPVAKLQPGDAVWRPGHVSIFGGWKNKRKRQFYALEQTTWGSHAKRRVRTIPSRGKALRYKGVRVAKKPRPAKPVAVPVAAAPSTESSGVVTAASVAR